MWCNGGDTGVSANPLSVIGSVVLSSRTTVAQARTRSGASKTSPLKGDRGVAHLPLLYVHLPYWRHVAPKTLVKQSNIRTFGTKKSHNSLILEENDTILIIHIAEYPVTDDGD